MVYTSNTPTVQAAVDGEIAVGFVNHYYLFRIRAEQGNVPAENYFPPNGDLGALINVAGASVIAGTKNQTACRAACCVPAIAAGARVLRHRDV